MDGKENKETTITFYIEEELKRAFEEKAKSENRTMSGQLRHLMLEFVGSKEEV